MSIKVTDEMFLQVVENNKKFQNLQKIRNVDFLTNPIEIISTNVRILTDYVTKEIASGNTPFVMNSLLLTYIFNVFESFNGFRDKKMALIKDSNITKEEKTALFDVIKTIEGTDLKPKKLKIINIIRNHFHHKKIEGIRMETKMFENELQRKLYVNEHPLIELVAGGLEDAIKVKQYINNKINELMSLYNIRDNTLQFNAYCRSHNMLDKVFVLNPEETEDELALYS